MFSKGNKPGGETAPEPPKMKTSSMPSIVSAGLQVTGNMTSDGDIQIEGTIVGDVKSRSVTIGTDGLVQGQVTAENVQVSGGVEGKIRAKTVVLVAGCKVLGDIIHDIGTQIGSPQRTFFLTHRPVVESLTVYVDEEVVESDDVVGWEYDDEFVSVGFHGDYVPDFGSSIIVAYDIGGEK